MINPENQAFESRMVESNIIKYLQEKGYSLNVVNRYKENILHSCAANDCVDIIKYIIQNNENHYIHRKNAFGWTPLMQAIRNENVEAVTCLLELGAVVNDFSFLGMSALSLATAISTEMFDILYQHCPLALEYAAHDDINPLCIAAMKNDKELFFKLVDLGLDVKNSNAFTHMMMKLSKIPEISGLAKSHHASEKYWDDISSIEDLLQDDKTEESEENSEDKESTLLDKFFPEISITNVNEPTSLNTKKVSKNHSSLPKLEVKCNELHNSISPMLNYVKKHTMPLSPFNTRILNKEKPKKSYEKSYLDFDEESAKKSKEKYILFDMNKISTDNGSESPLALHRLKNNRPANLNIRKSSTDSNATLSFTPQFSPMKTPNVPDHVNEDNVFDETTPTPPKYKTPPRGIILDPSSAKLMILLGRFGLKRHIPLFLEQEIDMDLFLSLTDQDLIEIGIHSKSERLILISVINECKQRGMQH